MSIRRSGLKRSLLVFTALLTLPLGGCGIDGPTLVAVISIAIQAGTYLSQTQTGQTIEEAVDKATAKCFADLLGQQATTTTTLLKLNIDHNDPNKATGSGPYLYVDPDNQAISATLNNPTFEKKNGTWQLTEQERQSVIKYYRKQHPDEN
jgi:hypothetical protein